MTAPLPDDHVRAMLEERAGRVSADAEREAMTAFRAAIRGAPDGKGGFAVIPQALSSRDARLPAGVAALGVVVVVVIAVLGGRLSGVDVATSPSAVAGSSAITGPAVSLAPSAAGSPTVLDPGQLEAALASGDLAGTIVVINGKLVSELCSGPPSDCKTHLLELPQLQITASDEPFIRAAWDSAIGGPAGPMTFRVGGDGSLDFLGVLGSVPDAPLTVDQLISTTAPAGRLVSVHGWLADVTRVALLVLTGGAPPTDGTTPARQWVTVEPAPEVARRLGPPGEPDTFIVRRANGGWRLEGRYAAFVPTTPSAQAGQNDLSADQLRAGLADGSLTGRVIVIDGEMQMMEVPCPKPGACTVPNLTKLGGVPITVDPAIEALVANDVPDGPHVFIGDGVGLTYLGTMTGAVDAPMSVAQLWAVSPAVGETGIRFVEGIVGPIPCVGCPTAPTMLPGLWLSGTNGSKAAAVPVFVPDTIEPPPTLDRYVVRPRFGSPCDGIAPPPGVVWDCTAEYRWAIVAAVGEEPILRVALP